MSLRGRVGLENQLVKHSALERVHPAGDRRKSESCLSLNVGPTLVRLWRSRTGNFREVLILSSFKTLSVTCGPGLPEDTGRAVQFLLGDRQRWKQDQRATAADLE